MIDFARTIKSWQNYFDEDKLTLCCKLVDGFAAGIPNKNTAIPSFSYIVRHFELLQLKEKYKSLKF